MKSASDLQKMTVTQLEELEVKIEKELEEIASEQAQPIPLEEGNYTEDYVIDDTEMRKQMACLRLVREEIKKRSQSN